MQSNIYHKESVAVVGAGLVGCITAIFLAKSGYAVTLYEQEEDIMRKTSRIPVHLHGGGLYASRMTPNNEPDLSEATHCLHDAGNFSTVLPFALVHRPTAIAVIRLDDQHIVGDSGKTQLMIEATKLYHKETGQKTGEIPAAQVALWKERANRKQEEKVGILQANMQQLAATDPNQSYRYKYYSVSEFARLAEHAVILDQDPDLEDFDGWATELSKVTDPNTILGVFMTNEVGLDMNVTAEKLEEILEENGVNVEYGSRVTDIRFDRDNTQFSLHYEQNDVERSQSFSQILNAAGYEASNLNNRVSQDIPIAPIDWSIEFKGVGIIEWTGHEFQHVPEVYFTEAPGMAHFGRHTATRGAVNYTTDYVDATYVRDGKVAIGKDQSIKDNRRAMELESSFMNSDTPLIQRTQACIDGCARFMPKLKERAIPKGYVPGGLAVIGSNPDDRHSKEVYISQSGYHAVNAVKGGGAVSAAMTSVSSIEKHSIQQGLRSANALTFPQNSDSYISPKYRLGQANIADIDREIEEVQTQLERIRQNKPWKGKIDGAARYAKRQAEKKESTLTQKLDELNSRKQDLELENKSTEILLQEMQDHTRYLEQKTRNTAQYRAIYSRNEKIKKVLAQRSPLPKPFSVTAKHSVEIVDRHDISSHIQLSANHGNDQAHLVDLKKMPTPELKKLEQKNKRYIDQKVTHTPQYRNLCKQNRMIQEILHERSLSSQPVLDANRSNSELLSKRNTDHVTKHYRAKMAKMSKSGDEAKQTSVTSVSPSRIIKR